MSYRACDILHECMFLTRAQSFKDLNVLLPWEIADPWARLRELTAFPLGLCVDIDSICRNVHFIFFPLDVYGLKTSPTQKMMLLSVTKHGSLINCL